MKYLFIIGIFIVIIWINKKVKARKKGTYLNKTATFDIEENDRKPNLGKNRIKREKIDSAVIDRDSYEYREPFFKKAGFLGIISYSPNYEYSLVFDSGNFDFHSKTITKKGEIALFEKDKLLFKKTFIQPNFCNVNNQGTVIIPDWFENNTLSGIIVILDKQAKQIYSYNAKANLGYGMPTIIVTVKTAHK